jgi:hypothetical protein
VVKEARYPHASIKTMKKRKRTGLKLYIVRYNVMAEHPEQAIKKIKDKKPVDVYVSEEWKNGQNQQLTDAIGFDDGITPEEDEEED